jgi:hypothetical protein
MKTKKTQQGIAIGNDIPNRIPTAQELLVRMDE